jgi:integrase
VPARQRGSAVQRHRPDCRKKACRCAWEARWYDENLKRKSLGGFESKTDALDFCERQVKEVSALRRGDLPTLRRQEMPTLGQLVTEYLDQHTAEANTLRTLKERLRYATEGAKLDGDGGWKDTRIDRIDVRAIGAWRKRLPERSAWGIHKALRQVLNYAVRVKLVEENVAALVPNPEPKRREIPTFETVAELEWVGEELLPRFRPIPILVGLTGLRPEEWLALEWRDIDRKAGIVHVRRVYTDGQLKLYGKQDRSLRAVPLPLRAAQALEELPTGIGATRLFSGERGGYLNLNEWRRDVWAPALVGAGLAHRGPYALRHSYASFSIAAGVSLFELARFMGTSVEQIDRTYGHLLPDSIERTRVALDAYIASTASAAAEGGAR